MQPAPQDAFSSDRVVPLRPAQPATPLSSARRARQVKLGRIFVCAGIISQDVLHEALTIAQDLKQPIGKVLTSTGQVSEKDLQSALLAQSMMAEGLLEEHLAVDVLKFAAKERVDFAQALEMIRHASRQSPVAEGLEELLLASGMVDQMVLTEARRQSLESNLPLGSTLMMMRAIVFAHLNCVFECLNLVGQGRISKQNAVRALQDIKRENIELSEALLRQRISPKNTQSKLKLGDLLTSGSVVSEKDTLAAVERALTEKRLIGEILVKSGLLSEDLLKDALDMQTLVVKGVISKEEACYVLRQMVAERKTVAQVLRERRSLEDDADTAASALDLLIKAKLVAPEAVPAAMAKQRRYEMDVLKALVASDVIPGSLCRAAVESARLVETGEMTQQEMVSVLHHCDRTRCEFEQALEDLGVQSASGNFRIALESVESRQSGQDRLRTSVFATSIEFKLAAIVLSLGAAGGVAAMVMSPGSLAGYCLLGVVFGVGIVFFALGRIWESRLAEKAHEEKRQEEAAKQQVSRLVKIRSRDTYQ